MSRRDKRADLHRREHGSHPLAAAPVHITLHTDLYGFQLSIPLGKLRLPGQTRARRRLQDHHRAHDQSQQAQQHLRRASTGARRMRRPQSGALPATADARVRATPQAVLRQRLESSTVVPAEAVVVHSSVDGRRSINGASIPAVSCPAAGGLNVLEQLRRTAEEPDEPFLLRWIRSRGFDLHEAEAAVRVHAAWRSQHVPAGGVPEAQIGGELAMQKVFFQGCDLQGRPVLIVLAARHNMSLRNLEETQQLIIYTLDNTAAAADPARNPLGRFLCLFDLSGLSMNNLDVKALRAIFELLQAHYPERLSELWFLNAPWIFWGLWRVVSPFISPATRDKIAFCSGGQRQQMLEGAIPPEVLPREYGGRAAMVPIQQAVAAQRAAAAAEDTEDGASSASGETEESSSVSEGRFAAAKRVTGRWASAVAGALKRGGTAVQHAAVRIPAPRMPAFWSRDSEGKPLDTALSFRERSMSLLLTRPSMSLLRRGPARQHPDTASLPPLLEGLLLPPRLLLSLLLRVKQVVMWAWEHTPSLRPHPARLPARSEPLYTTVIVE